KDMAQSIDNLINETSDLSIDSFQWQTYLELVEVEGKGRGYCARIDISAGEEVCISYNEDHYLPVVERRKYLREHTFNFDCLCERCALDLSDPKHQFMTVDMDGNLLELNEANNTIRERYDTLMHRRKGMRKWSSFQMGQQWMQEGEKWLEDARRVPYRLHPHHWMCKHMYEALHDGFMVILESGHQCNRSTLKEKVLCYYALDIKAEAAVLPHYLRSAVDLFVDDCVKVGKSTRWAYKEARKLDPDVDQIIKRING
ncbi:unnamed protein product, partial [Rotaria magnacalcarata]